MSRSELDMDTAKNNKKYCHSYVCSDVSGQEEDKGLNAGVMVRKNN